MNDEVRQRAEARRWFAIAERDMSTAEHCLGAVPPLLESAAYFCEQAAEKLMKGLLVAAACPFPKTHNLKDLASRTVPLYPDLDESLRRVQPWTIWGFAYRYPFEEEQEASSVPSARELKEAVQHLQALRNMVDEELQGEPPRANTHRGNCT